VFVYVAVRSHPILFVALVVSFSLSILQTRCHRVLCLNLPCQNLWIVRAAAAASLVVVVVVCIVLLLLLLVVDYLLNLCCFVERDFSWILININDFIF
jgi:hypothetical protein